MSDHQSDGAIIGVANHLFGRTNYGEWKKHMTNSETTKNTLPAHSNRRRVEVQVEAMTLHMIVEELMTGEACVVYSNDGSAQSGMGNCCSIFKHQWCSKKFAYFWNIHRKKRNPC